MIQENPCPFFVNGKCNRIINFDKQFGCHHDQLCTIFDQREYLNFHKESQSDGINDQGFMIEGGFAKLNPNQRCPASVELPEALNNRRTPNSV